MDEENMFIYRMYEYSAIKVIFRKMVGTGHQLILSKINQAQKSQISHILLNCGI
jgi:hypothetical protein